MTTPFEGLRVLELSGTQVGAGIGQFFADYGADVTMVEPPGGSRLRDQAAFPFWARGSAASSSTPAIAATVWHWRSWRRQPTS